MLYDLFFALFEAFKWIIVGTAIMCGLFLLFVVLPAMLFDTHAPRHERKKEKIRFNKELEAQHATFYKNDANDVFDNKFFERIHEHVFGNIIEEPFKDQEAAFDADFQAHMDQIDTSIETVLRDEHLKFLSGKHMVMDEAPTFFEESIGRHIRELPMNLSADPFPKLLRSTGMDTFLKNTNGDTDGFPELA
jgi:hypothetical protein